PCRCPVAQDLVELLHDGLEGRAAMTVTGRAAGSRTTTVRGVRAATTVTGRGVRAQTVTGLEGRAATTGIARAAGSRTATGLEGRAAMTVTGRAAGSRTTTVREARAAMTEIVPAAGSTTTIVPELLHSADPTRCVSAPGVADGSSRRSLRPAVTRRGWTRGRRRMVVVPGHHVSVPRALAGAGRCAHSSPS
ncbi:MAG: hypothetical protein ACKOFF_03760, partial [Acidimicrobiales bacterium]